MKIFASRQRDDPLASASGPLAQPNRNLAASYSGGGGAKGLSAKEKDREAQLVKSKQTIEQLKARVSNLEKSLETAKIKEKTLSDTIAQETSGWKKATE